jgi:triosephosphate isomerase
MEPPVREIIVAGNWKMNTDAKGGVELALSVSRLCSRIDRVKVVVAPPATHLSMVVEALITLPVEVAAQNLHWDASGAYTGEISAEMLLSIGVNWAIIGHSERRKYFGETDLTVNMRARKALESGIRPIVCIGETLEERDLGVTFEVLERQLRIGLDGLEVTGKDGLVIAYEPVWAIGTGRNASPSQAEEAHAFIRSVLAGMAGSPAAEATVIQYGGSVTDLNARELMACPNVDGALVGGASLKPEKFGAIIEAARSKA